MQKSNPRFTGQRQELIQRFFPNGIPLLWCPSLTHYADDGAIDRARMRAHLKFMHPAVGGFLIPGSTGEGWEQSDAEVRELLDFMIDEIHEVRAYLLIGILKTKIDDVLQAMRDTIAWLKRRAGNGDILAAMAKSSVCGFTVCPPSGSALGQNEIRTALEEVLSLGVPVSLYQLPQVTENEMTPETVAALAAKFPNFYLFKDTSGADRVAAVGFRDAFLVRGAEGGYAGHFAAGGGNYDGFLLSTANCFGPQLAEMIENVQRGRKEEAEAFSGKLTAICDELFDLAGKVGYGNAFTNANKAMDHFFARGPAAAKITPPRLYSGKRLPQELIEAAGAALKRHGLLPKAGYLASA
jgi:dihydrodipicolinate synthase/N-acetylneuraminate lyase